ncbi:MAG: hypothetical protein J7L61_03430 [Thermoplasmata archaeon]|nr:hypothetical protein [Thermoplasmata archaeon]
MGRVRDRIPFLKIKARVFCQATESRPRVEQALRHVIGDASLMEDRAEGYHGNPITILSGEVSKAGEMRKVIDRLGGREKMREEILPSIEERVDDNGLLHLRLSKQAAYLGETKLVHGKSPGGIIHLEFKVRAYPASLDNMLRAVRDWLE